MIVGDFGSGAGYLTIPIARIVGERGKVYAVDIQQNALEQVKQRAALEHISWIEPVWADLELPKGSRLPDHALDLVIIANIAFQAEKKEAVFLEARRIVRTGGALAVIEWDRAPSPVGPPPAMRVPRATVEKLAADAGFRFSRAFNAGSHHYGLFFEAA